MKKKALIVLPMLLLVACAGGGTSGLGSKVGKQSSASAFRRDEVTAQKDGDVGVLGGAAFTVKNYLQLKGVADQCLGAGLGTVTADMFTELCPGKQASEKPPLKNDQKVILGRDKCGLIGTNIIEANKSRLWDPESAARTTTLANTLNPDYLSALAEVADVYTHGIPEPMTLCGTVEAATRLAGNCLGQFEPAALTAAVNHLQTQCAKGSKEAREAIATMIGSAAFAANSKL
ncbi:MAG: hypothetical protein FJ146_06310 [Deltaproteobacteria bacterium]|nr:hypothetical protein [Deltaproteobacteria bacterium]